MTEGILAAPVLAMHTALLAVLSAHHIIITSISGSAALRLATALDVILPFIPPALRAVTGSSP
ncbi:hypothetical protein B0H19DRAFT_1274299 [Mycena capillaripes]|nr:hypothetical protein B0H19DRAFT_1274299 [Mycena capillaripes]